MILDWFRPFTYKCYMKNMVEVGSVVPKGIENVKMFRTNERLYDERQTTTDISKSDSSDLKCIIPVKHIHK